MSAADLNAVRPAVREQSPEGNDVLAFQTGKFQFALGMSLDGMPTDVLEELVELQGRRVVGVLREKGKPGLMFEGDGWNLVQLVPSFRIGTSNESHEAPEGYFENDEAMNELGRAEEQLLENFERGARA